MYLQYVVRLEQILISDSSKPLDNTFRVSVVVTNIPPIRLGGRKKKVFGLAFHDPDAVSQNKWLTFMPEFAGRLEDCCLATALLYGISYNQEMKANEGKKTLRVPITEGWKALSRLNAKDANRAANARQYLYEQTLAMCEERGLDPKEFHLTDLESLPSKVDKLGVNLHVYSQEAGYQLAFKWPQKTSAEREMVNVLTVENPCRNVQHCGIIKRIGYFFSSKNRIGLQYFHRVFHRIHFKFHKGFSLERLLHT